MNGEDHVAEAKSQKEAIPSKPEDIPENNTKTDIVNAIHEGNHANKFVLTPDYIQQSKYSNNSVPLRKVGKYRK